MAVSREQLDELYAEILDMAVHLLEKSGEFFPIGMVVKADGQRTHVAFHDGNEHPPSLEVIAGLRAIFRTQAAEGTILASALASDTRVRPAAGGNPIDAIHIMLRSQEFCRDVVVPYTVATTGLFRKKRAVTLGSATAQAADQEIFV